MARGSVKIDEEFCKGCGLCVEFCPQNVLSLDSSRLNMKGYHPAFMKLPEDCIGCGICGLMCPDVAIMVERGDN